MPYPILSGPYGLLPQNLIGGQVFAGSTRMIPIASGYGTSLYFGDPVKFTTTGTLITSGLAYNTAATETGGTLGIFLGCEYTPGSTATVLGSGPLYGKNRYQFWAASTVANDAVAYVCDDYDTVFKAAVGANPGAASAVLTLNAYANPLMVGTNFTSVATSLQNTGVQSNLSGNSNVVVVSGASSARVTTTTPFRCVGLVPETVVALSQTANTATSTTMTLTSTNAQILPGMIVTGSGIPANAYVSAVSGTTVTLSAAATSSLTAATFNFVGYPEVLLKFNFGYHAYTNPVAI
jgi:hypothetical protein